MEKYFELLKAQGADDAVMIDPHSVVTAPWVTLKCQYGCGTYGHSHCCPPHSPDYQRTRAVIDCYTKVVLFHCVNKYHISRIAQAVAKELFLDGYYKALAFGSGPCKLCPECDLEACRHPELAIPSMEACGIDVFATARANGFTIRTLREKGEERNHFGLLLVE